MPGHCDDGAAAAAAAEGAILGDVACSRMMERRREGRRERHLVAGKKTATKKTLGKERSGGLIACAFLHTGEGIFTIARR